MSKAVKSVCPLGIEFSSKSAMCRHYGVSLKDFESRKKRGWTLGQILGLDKPPEVVYVVCPNGLKFKTTADMVNHYNTKHATYLYRKSIGMTERQALGIDVDSTDYITCPLGHVFRTQNAMCSNYNVQLGTYKTRVSLGWTERQALGIDPPPRAVICPLGKTFKSEKNMCEHYRVAHPTFDTRKNKLGWTLRQSLNIDPPPDSRSTVYCPNGLKFGSKRDMCKYYNTNTGTYDSRKKVGWTERQALGIDPHTRALVVGYLPTEVQIWNEDLLILQKEENVNGNQFYLAQDKETMKNYVLTEEQIKTYPQSLQKFNKVK